MVSIYPRLWHSSCVSRGSDGIHTRVFVSFCQHNTSRPIIPKVTAIKLIPITADVISTYFVYRIVRIKYPRGNKPYWAAGVFFILPTIFINSAHWGQMDALYTLFIIISLFFFLKEKPLLGMLAYALSFSIKIQTIFFIPFLVILFLKKKSHGGSFF